MKRLILTTACATALLSFAACRQETTEANISINAEDMNYADNMADVNDMNMTNDMNVTNDMGNAADNAVDNATGNAAIDNSSGY